MLIVSALNVINNVASHVYYICEHLAWLGDNQMININSGIHWLISTVAWLISLIASVVCNVIALKNMITELKSTEVKDKKFFKK